MGKKGGFFKGIMLGSLIGATLGVLFAPKAGKKLRDDLKKKYAYAKKKLDAKIKEFEPKTRATYNKIVKEVLTSIDKVKKMDRKDFEILRKKLEATWEEFSKKLNKVGLQKKKVTGSKRTTVRKRRVSK